MCFFLSIFLFKAISSQCEPVEDGAAGTCRICSQETGLCETCNYKDNYEPNQEGSCSPKPPRCVAIENGEGGSCSKCNTTTDLCSECNLPDEYEPNEEGNCSLIAKCNSIPDGAEGTCASCNTTTDLCEICNHADKYIPNEYGNCSEKIPKCVSVPLGGAGSCETCDTINDICLKCNYPNKYKPNENGTCSIIPKKCNPVENGEAGSCAICDETTDCCKTCNLPDQYEPNELGNCSLIRNCKPVLNGDAGTCAVCNETADLCQECNLPDQYEPNELGNCTLIPRRCTAVVNGDAGTCAVCNTTSDLCQTCNYPDKYEPNELGNCTLVKKCNPVVNGDAGTCAVCNDATDLCQTCNYPDKYEPNELGSCSLVKKCKPAERGEGGTCSVCNEATDLCQTCNYPDKYEPNELGNCSLIKKCKPVLNGDAGTCSVCNETADLCQTCNHQDKYEPNELGSCSLIRKCKPAEGGEGGTCAVCNEATDLCQTCNYPERYSPNQEGTCTLKQSRCKEELYGAGGTCKTCNLTTDLCQVCNYLNEYEPNNLGNCSAKPYVKCVNVTDGAAGTCGKCDEQTHLCTYCNYPDIYQPDQHGGCEMKPQAQCEPVLYGAAGTCSVCNDRTHLCEICNYPHQYAPSPFGNCSLKSRNGCSELVSNCHRCDKKDPNKCVECHYGFGLRGGFCTRCAAHLYEDSRHPCNPDCSHISNCHTGHKYDDDDCESENGEVYCLTCNHGYHPSSDYQSCIRNVPGKCSITIPGCLECEYEGSRECSKCDESKNFILDREDNECRCKKGFEFVLGECQKVKEVECSKSLHKCEKCAFDSNTCIECDDDYGLENGKCVKCQKGAHVSGKLPCLKACTTIPNCAFCSDDGKYCFECQHGYEETDDHSKCYSEGHADCQNVIGCTKCSKSDPTFCLKCDKHNHFEESDIFPGTCVCDEDYDFVNNECVDPYYPAIPPSGPSDQHQIDQSQTEFEKYVIVTGTIYTIIASAQFNPGTMYILLIPIEITKIEIPKGPTNFQLNIPKASEGKSVTINADVSTQVDLSCPNGANIAIPDNNNNYNLKGSGLITIDPPQGATSAIIKKISLDQSGNTMTLYSRKAHISVKEIEIYGRQVLASRSIDYQTSVEVTKIQSGSTFSPENISFTVLKIGVQSVLRIKGNSHVKVQNYQVYFNTSKVNKVPIQFTSPFPDLSQSTIEMLNIDQGALLQEEIDYNETFNVASFSGENSLQACQSLKFTAGTNFGSTECVTQGTTTYMVAKRALPEQTKKSKKLSGGAIAGIVIGCVVAVGLVVFLCVWFLVVKKRAIPAHPRAGEPVGSRERLEI